MPERPPIETRAAGERTAVLGLAVLHFLVLGAWYVLRPLRDEFATVEPELVPVLWRDVFLAMLVASPVFAALAGRLSRGALVAGAFGLFGASTAGFALFFERAPAAWHARGEHAFYVYCGVVSLFAVSVFWSFAVDLVRAGTAARWFGPIAAAGTLGQGASSFALGRWRASIEPAWWLALAGGVFAAAAGAALVLDAWDRRTRGAPSGPIAGRERGGGFLEGLLLVFRSRYLLAIVAYIALLNTSGALFYLQQSEILGSELADRAARGAYLADLNLWVSAATLLGQAFLNAWLLARLGVGATLAGLPVVATLGLAALGLAQFAGAGGAVLLAVLAVAEVSRRAASFALAKPTRELLFTLVSRNEKYRSKNFIDTAVYRGVDAAAAEGATWLRTGAGLALHGVAFAALPLMAAWGALALGLGRLARARARAEGARDAERERPA